MSQEFETQLDDLLLAVELNGDPTVLLPSHHLADLESIISKVQQKGLRIAGVPPGSITVLPLVPMSRHELQDVCLRYIRANSEEERAVVRRSLYNRPFPLFKPVTSTGLPVLYHPADYIIRLVHLLCKVYHAPESDVSVLMRTNAYLQIKPIREVCFELRRGQSNPIASQSSLSSPLFYDPGSSSRWEKSFIGQESEMSNDLTDHSSTPGLTPYGTVGEYGKSSPLYDDPTGDEVVDEVTTKSEYLSEADFALVEDNDIYHYDLGGRLVAVFIKNAIPVEVCSAAAAVLKGAATKKNMRANTNGGQPPDTGVVGFYDYLNNPTQHKCRETQYMREHSALLEHGCKDFMKKLDALYFAYAKDCYGNQHRAIPPGFRMYDTVFSTITVNHNFRTAVHRDKGDFPDGLAALSVIDGTFDGCDLAVKALGKRFPLQKGDVLFFNASLEHGNTEVHNLSSWERVSVVCYLRTGLMSSFCENERRRQLDRVLESRLNHHRGFEEAININEANGDRAPLYVPRLLKEKLAPVQLDALNFASECISNNNGCIIALTMGLGKTLVALSLCYSRLCQKSDEDILIVAPKQIISHWKNEYEKWDEFGLRFDSFIASDGSDNQRPEFERALNLYQKEVLAGRRTTGHVFVLNQEYLASFVNRFPDFSPSLILADEGHKMGSKGSKYSLLVNKLGGVHVALTGTPLQNEADELYRLVCWVNKSAKLTLPPRSFQTQSNCINHYISGKTSNLAVAVEAQRFLLDWMTPFIFRDMAVDLPPLHDYIIVCNVSELQEKLLVRLGVTENSPPINAAEHRPHLVSSHPVCYFGFMLGKFPTDVGKREREGEGERTEEVEDAVDQQLTEDQRTAKEWRDAIAQGFIEPFIKTSGKVAVLVEIAKAVVERGDKMIIFSQYVASQDLIHRVLTAVKIKTLAIRGRDTCDRRQHHMVRFKNEKDLSAIVLSTKIAAYGLDFSNANHVVLFDSWWNPQVDAQAIARSYRRNQEKEVTVYRLATLNTDISILKAQARKSALFNCIMHEKTAQQTEIDTLSPCEETEADKGRKRLWLRLKNDVRLQGNCVPSIDAVYRCNQ